MFIFQSVLILYYLHSSVDRYGISFDTVTFFQKYYECQKAQVWKKTIQTTEDLADLLQYPEPSSLFVDFRFKQHTSLEQLAEMFYYSLKEKPHIKPKSIIIVKLANRTIPSPMNSLTPVPRMPKQNHSHL